MLRDSKNIIPVSMAVLLHVVIFGSMITAYEYARPTPFTPLAVQATLVTEVPESTPPPPVVEPEPEPEPEPIIEEPEPEPEPDNSEELRRQAEEERRRQDALIEQERLEKLRQQEEEADRKRKEREEAERQRREEEEKERKRKELERKRLEDIQRQREENERERLRLEDRQRRAEIDAESERLAAVDSGELAVYMAQIRQSIERNWSAPASFGAELKCSVRVRQVPGGEVVGVTFVDCTNDGAVRRSVEAAIYKSSPLPVPSNPNLFDRNILLNLSLRQ